MTASIKIVAYWSPFFAVYYTYLGLRTVRARIKTRTSLYSTPPSVSASSPQQKGKYSELERCIRAHAHFGENVPLALLMLAICELNQASPAFLHGMCATLVASRILHADFGLLSKENGLGFGRQIGYASTLLVIVGAAIKAAWLSL
ncbi:uncharacterized protein VTP21DRAFT_2325 [Calcarisporiella thermophila]|uniref:uncharacterized protein n=1 Tax=Calcarisporiella thermophila TaxID=911321 RepID=UPI00374436E2